jgi:hypothetical protein
MAIKRLPVTKEAVKQFISDNYSDLDSFTAPYGFESVAGTGTFTVPFGVTKIFAVLIGGGGSCGSISVGAQTFSSAGSASDGNRSYLPDGGDTTLTVGVTVYTAVGGKWGGPKLINRTPIGGVIDVNDDFGFFDGFGSTSTNIGPGDGDGSLAYYTDYPGTGGYPGHGATITCTTFGADYGYTERASGRCTVGQAGQTTFHEINVASGTQIAYSVGAAGNNAGTGAIYISY